jgi:hypothetical protein
MHLLGSQGMKVTTYPYVMPRLGMRGIIPPLPWYSFFGVVLDSPFYQAVVHSWYFTVFTPSSCYLKYTHCLKIFTHPLIRACVIFITFPMEMFEET